MPKAKTTRDVGKQAEQIAKNYLKQQGLVWVESNYCCQKGEIDLIMLDKHQLVFTEVKFRQSTNYGSGLELVTKRKQSKIIYAARHYLYNKGLTETISSRFDIISITPNNTKQQYYIQWLKNAFYSEH